MVYTRFEKKRISTANLHAERIAALIYSFIYCSIHGSGIQFSLSTKCQKTDLWHTTGNFMPN